MALVTVQRSPSPSASAETDEVEGGQDATDSSLKSPRNRRRKSRSALKKLKKLFNTVRFVTKLKPCFSENYFTVKGAALILPQSDYETAFTRKATKSHGGDIQSHLQSMFSLLRPLDTIKVAVKLEGSHDRYLALVSCLGKQDTEESVILGMDLRGGATAIALIMPVWAHTYIKLDGDGGFSITSNKEIRSFKPVSVQAMWSALQSLNKVVKIANDHLYIPGGLTHTWVGFYDSKRSTEYQIISEWNASVDIDNSSRTDSSISAMIDNSDEGAIYKTIKTELKLVMMSVDLEEVTCKFLRESLEKTMGMNLREYRSFIDSEMLEILGQMDAPSKIEDYLYLGSEWNASNIEELQKSGVHYILNVSREIDNFYPGILHYMNVREWDNEQADLMKHWEDTHRFISRARKKDGKVLVHCKMGISRSASTVMAYLMKENKWSLEQAFQFTKNKRSIVNPNSGFMKQLETYEGILIARRKYIENVNKMSAAGGVVPTEEGEENVDLEVAFPSTAEEMLAMKLGKEADEYGGYQYIFNTEPDIELSSRSADSTEESLPDERSPQPADESEKGATGGAFLYASKKKVKSSSGDYLETDSSDNTDTEEISDSDDNDNDNEGFRPIEVPKIDIQVIGKGKGRRKHDIKKVEARRSKSESDKHSLTVDSKAAGLPREGSVSKFKPDESWIKLVQSDEEEQQAPEAMDISQGEEGTVDSTAEVKHDDDGLWMGEIKISSEVFEKPDENQRLSMESKANVERDSAQPDLSEDYREKAVAGKGVETVVDKDSSDAGVDEKPAKESIPVSTGLVQKQKQGYEGMFKISTAHKKTASLGSTDLQILCQSDTVRRDSETVSVSSGDQEMRVDPQSQSPDADTKTCDAVIRKESDMDVDQSGDAKSDTSETSATQKTKMRTRLSVYDLEEIDLPEDFVKKTKQQIEDRLSVETPRKRIQRSSSLKSKRVTPKAKDRDNERRKTCIAMLSPTTPDHSLRGEIKSEQGEVTSSKSSSDQSEEEDFSVMPSAEIEGAAEGKADETGTVKVYKYMGEELTVQEGLVKKQTLGLEQKATGDLTTRPSSRQETEIGTLSDSSSICSVSTDVSNRQKDRGLSQDVKSISSGVYMETEANSANKSTERFTKDLEPVQNKKFCDKGESARIVREKEPCAKPDLADKSSESKVLIKDLCIDSAIGAATVKKIDSIRANFQDKEERMETDSAAAIATPVASRKWGLKKQSSRFDEETLELIREIGSALMNSPAKTEVEEENDAPLEGGSLVSHYVRNIERRVRVSKKKKSAREIIIVDKDSTHDSAKSSLQQPSTPTKICDTKSEITSVTHPKWSPVSKTPPSCSPTSKKPSSPSSVTSSPETVQLQALRGSPVAKRDSIQKPDPSNLSLNLKLEESPKAELVEKDEVADKDSETETCSVKNLVGKFETSSGKTTPISMTFGSPGASYPLLPGANTDTELIERKDKDSASTVGPIDETNKTSQDVFSGRCFSPKAEVTKTFHEMPGSHCVSPKSVKPRSYSDIPSYSAFSRPVTSPTNSRKVVHRQSEPNIHLSERNIQLLDAKLRESGVGLIPSACIIESEEEDTDSVQDTTVPTFFLRSRSEDQETGSRERRSRMIGAKAKTSSLGHAETLSESDSQEMPMFTWEGKKFRKNYGKSHPLSKLEGTCKGSIRSSPFYSTM